jgi:hypothetical protein
MKSYQDQWFVELDKTEATEVVVANHYRHRPCPISWCWGIRVEGEIMGVLTVGKPCSWSTYCGVVGETRADLKRTDARNHNAYELNRLWLSDSLPRNSESKFLGWCLRQLRKINPEMILVSYADSAMGHVGTVYQATRWIYTGTSVGFTDVTSRGRIARTPKHRYVWLASRGKREIAWNAMPYPKVPAIGVSGCSDKGATA